VGIRSLAIEKSEMTRSMSVDAEKTHFDPGQLKGRAAITGSADEFSEY